MLVCSLCPEPLAHHLGSWDAPIPLLATSALKMWHMDWKTSEDNIKARMCQGQAVGRGGGFLASWLSYEKYPLFHCGLSLAKLDFQNIPLNHLTETTLKASHYLLRICWRGGNKSSREGEGELHKCICPSLNRNTVREKQTLALGFALPLNFLEMEAIGALRWRKLIRTFRLYVHVL